jgi:FMN-dependent NADH-azoreductase
MKLMHVDASPKGAFSNSRALARFFIEKLKSRGVPIELDYLDLVVDTPPHTSGTWSLAAYTPPQDRTPEMKEALVYSDTLCNRLLSADALLFAMPMYNFSIPSAFKAFVDSIVRGGVTYIPTPDGQYVGQLSRQKVLFVTSRGADLRPGAPMGTMDMLTPALKTAFGFIGVANPLFVDAQPMQFAEPKARAEAMARAEAELDTIAADWSKTERLAVSA